MGFSVNFNNNGMGDNDLVDFMKSAKKYPYYPSVSHFTTEQTVSGANMHIKLIRSALTSQTGMNQYRYFDYSVKLTANAGSRACFVRFPAKVGNDEEWTNKTYYLNLLVTTNTNNPITCVKPSTINGITSYQYETSSSEMASTMSEVNYGLEVFGSNWGYLNTNNIQFGVNDVAEKMNALKTEYGDYKIQRYTNGTSGVINTYCLPNQVGRGNTQAFSYQSFAFPVFDYDNTDGIKNYLTNGDDSGSVDPFDPNNPKIVTVTDYKTDFTLYLTKGNNGTHFSATATNAQFVSARDVLADDYAMYVGAGVTTFDKMRTPNGQQTLTKSWSHNITQTNGITDYNVLLCFGDSIPVSEWDLSHPENTSGYFTVGLKYKQSSEVGCGVATVSFKATATGTSEHPTRTSVTDGYLYTASTGEKLKVLFRAITTDDLKDINDDGYDNESDTEDTSTGTTATEVCGHGLGTYKVSQAGFDAINDALWSTDWTQLFKSNTIDPVKCVISCKGIPFAHSGTATEAVYVANQRILCSAGKCNPVNTYNIGSYTIQAINNNFTDMTMTKVRVYLPYIAWVELPAEEVISRVGRAEVGLASVTKLLNFKYIVDFVDGSCRCVISVNGTERWFFDGNCGVDIPVTSDNHTSAINNAIKSGVQTVMNVGLAVGSAYAGNAMGVASGITGAIGSMANTIPTYNYSATANSSGYINHSMGNKIVIVIESPNVQMPNGYGHKYGFPCMRNLTLGGLSGYTKCENVDLSGINGTNYELNYIKSALESGVYL